MSPRKISVKKAPAAAPAETLEIAPVAKKAPAAPRKRAAKLVDAGVDIQAPSRKSLLTIDYPQAAETIVSRQYTLRLTAADEIPAVEISIDGGDWLPCRASVGHWWFDWEGYSEGEHTLRARAPQGGKKAVARRDAAVVFSGQY